MRGRGASTSAGPRASHRLHVPRTGPGAQVAASLSKTIHNPDTSTGIDPLTTVERYSKIDKKEVEVQCPSITREYNKHIGGVDNANAMVSYYRTPCKAKRWYFPIFTYVLDTCVVHAWFAYKFDCQERSEKLSIPLKNFRSDLAKALASVGRPKRGRPPSTSSIPRPNFTVVRRPQDDVRTDTVAHSPLHTTKGRCNKV